MAIPPTLDEWKAAVINPNNAFCDEFKKLLQMPMLLYTWFSWAFESDGQRPTSEFIQALGGTGVIPADIKPGKVVGLSAISGFAGYIYLSWQSMPGATAYYIYRNTTDDILTATNIGTANGIAYADTTAVASTTYYYWVKAWNAIGYGDPSDSVTGSCVAGSTATQYISGSSTIAVPAAMNRLTVKIWGGGGGGGYGTRWSRWLTLPSSGDVPDIGTLGGGGGGGGYTTLATYTVAVGNNVTVVIGVGGAPGQQGGASYVSYGGIELARANGGNPGGEVSGGTGGQGSGQAGYSSIQGSTGLTGNSQTGGAGGTASSAGLPSGTTYGTGGTGGGASNAMDIALPTYGIGGFVILEFTAV